MAGRHRGGGNAKVAQVRTDQRQARRRERMTERMARAGSPAERVGVAAEHLRAVLPRLDPPRAERIADEGVRVLLALVERAYVEEMA